MSHPLRTKLYFPILWGVNQGTENRFEDKNYLPRRETRLENFYRRVAQTDIRSHGQEIGNVYQTNQQQF